MKLYSGPLSLFTAKVRIALAEKGLAYERVEVGWSVADRYLPHHPEVAALNPKAEVPVLVDGDVVVYDSTLVLQYLEDRHPEPPLYPSDPADRARCRQWEAWADEIFFPSLWDLIEEAMYPAGEAGRDAERLEAARARIAEHHATLDKELSGRSYLCDAFSVADIGATVMFGAAANLGASPADDLPHLSAWMQRCGERPAVRDEMAAMIAYSMKALAGPG